MATVVAAIARHLARPVASSRCEADLQTLIAEKMS
jgi:hypothetical protein